MTLDLSSNYLAEIETFATELAAHSGEILWRLFPNPLGTPEDLNVRFKDSQKRDPVTRADNEVQDYLVSKIKTAYPDHGVLGEEGENEEELVPDIVWVLDPLDGTRNFMYGFPFGYASQTSRKSRRKFPPKILETSASPPGAVRALSAREFVTPACAETTSTGSRSIRSRTIRKTFWMDGAVPSEVPPNFMMIIVVDLGWF